MVECPEQAPSAQPVNTIPSNGMARRIESARLENFFKNDILNGSSLGAP